ncbi:MAG: non-homologous end-joining DNA ligase [Acidimicrobiia bacterium]|nr:non-homologous end-joining DNA ligase [Acidimicrobiia bacterium]
MIRFGVSGLPPEGVEDDAFLDGLVADGRRAYELAFVKEFPWNERRCEEFGGAAAERDIWLSVHAPYFAILTVEDEEKSKQCLAALEHTMKLGRALGSRIICAHFGPIGERSPQELMDVIRQRLASISPKVAHLGVGLGLETAGNDRTFGSIGDIATLAAEFPFVRPIIDWAHVHAMTGGGLTSKDAYATVIAFIRDSFPAWMIEPLQCQFTDNLVGGHGEVKHVPYGEGTLRVGPLVEAATEAGLRMVMISEAREEASHRAIQEEVSAALPSPKAPGGSDRSLGSGRVTMPGLIEVAAEKGGFRPGGLDRALRLSNIDKPFFPDGFTKGDLIQYYASIAPVLLPHLAGRAIVMARFPDGSDGDFFYEKQAPGHQPDWMPLASIHSQHRGEPIEFVTASDREALMWLANMGCIEIHPWLSRVDNLDNPDFAVFDLDPADGATWQQVVDVAGVVKLALERLGLRSYPKTSGATGLHIYVPLEPLHDYSRVRAFVERVGRLLVAADPDGITMEWDIPKRAGKVFIDHNQNVGGKTIASVYSVRPRPGAPVSTPLVWNEVGRVEPDDFTIANVWDRLQRFGDLFAPVLKGGQTLDAAEAALGIEPAKK